MDVLRFFILLYLLDAFVHMIPRIGYNSLECPMLISFGCRNFGYAINF